MNFKYISYTMYSIIAKGKYYAKSNLFLKGEIRKDMIYNERRKEYKNRNKDFREEKETIL